jgi:O-antigen/teichoic acid export membrane protein
MRLLWACGKPALSAAIVSILRPGLVALLVLMSCFFLPGATTARVSLAAFALATIVVVGIGAKAIRSHRKKRDAIVKTPEYEKTVWLKTAIPLLLASSFQVVMTQCSVIMIGYFLGLTEAGYYAAAVRMVGLAGFGLMATNVVVAPMISAAYTSDRRDDLKKALRSGAATIFGLTVPLVVVLLVAGKFGLWLFGESFTVAYPALVVLCVGQIVNALCGCVGYLMSMTGNERTAAGILCCSAILNVTLNATLIPIWGMTGAAIATSVTLVVWNVWMLVVVWKRLGMNPSILAWLSR